MFDGYIALGGNEIGNNARTQGYTKTADCPTYWLKDRDCGGLVDALQDDPYVHSEIAAAPWFDTDEPDLSARFLGAYIVTMAGASDSTRVASVTEKNTDGAQVSGYRHSSREVRVRMVLTAVGEEALEFGMTWLRNSLEPNACGIHGGSCGSSDMSFFVSCPPVQDASESDADYALRIDPLRRYLHTVTCISGPLVQERYKSRDGRHVGYLVEFTLLAAVPFVFGITKDVAVPPTPPTIVQDTPYNLEPYPSAELSTGTVIVARNLATNPSIETNAIDVAHAQAVVSGTSPAAFLTWGRTTELHANDGGVASYRGRLLGDGGTTPVTNARSTIDIYEEVSLAGLAAGTRISFNVWAALISFAGPTGTTLNAVTALVEWRTASAAVVTTPIGVAASNVDLSGKAYVLKSQAIPSTATIARVIVRYDFTWSSSSTPATNSDVRAYFDALAISIP